MFGDFTMYYYSLEGRRSLVLTVKWAPIFNRKLYNLAMSYDYNQKIAQVKLYVHSY